MEESVVLSRVRKRGYGSAFAPDLLAIGTARRQDDVDGGEEVARRFLLAGQRLQGLNGLSPDVLSATFGLEGFEASRVLALLELGRRVGIAGKGPVEVIQSPADVFSHLEFLAREKQEYFYALLLDAKNNLLRAAEIHKGTLTESIVGPREIFREAIREGASSLIVAHNHPSGDPTPSPEDISVTRKLVMIGNLLDMPVHDHVIIGERVYKSLRTEGLM